MFTSFFAQATVHAFSAENFHAMTDAITEPSNFHYIQHLKLNFLFRSAPPAATFASDHGLCVKVTGALIFNWIFNEIFKLRI